MRVLQFEILEVTKHTHAKIGVWQVRQMDCQDKGSHWRKDFSFPVNNAAKKQESLDNAIEYAKKAVPYD